MLSTTASPTSSVSAICSRALVPKRIVDLWLASALSRYNRDFVRACDSMNEAVRLLENQGDTLSTALTLKYASPIPSQPPTSCWRLGSCAPFARTGRTGPALVTLQGYSCLLQPFSLHHH